MLDTIDANTEEIVKLRIDIQRLLIISPADVFRKLEELEQSIEKGRIQDSSVNPNHSAALLEN